MESSHRSPRDCQHVQVVPGRGGERVQMVRLQATHKRRSSFDFSFVYNLKESLIFRERFHVHLILEGESFRDIISFTIAEKMLK